MVIGFFYQFCGGKICLQLNILNLLIQFNDVQELWLFQYNKNELIFLLSLVFSTCLFADSLFTSLVSNTENFSMSKALFLMNRIFVYLYIKFRFI